MKDDEIKVRCVMECLYYSECHENYAWALHDLPKFEPRHCLSCAQFMFADGLIGEELLSTLDITDSCTLRADCLHCVSEDFPKLFGDATWFNFFWSHAIAALKGTETEWNENFSRTKKKV